MTDIFRKCFMMEGFFAEARHRRQPQNLAQHGVVIGQIFQPVAITIQS